jgi:hypothetical protein
MLRRPAHRVWGIEPGFEIESKLLYILGSVWLPFSCKSSPRVLRALSTLIHPVLVWSCLPLCTLYRNYGCRWKWNGLQPLLHRTQFWNLALVDYALVVDIEELCTALLEPEFLILGDKIEPVMAFRILWILVALII